MTSTKSLLLLLLLLSPLLRIEQAGAQEVTVAVFFTEEAIARIEADERLPLLNRNVYSIATDEVAAVNASFAQSGVQGRLKLVASRNTGFPQQGCLYKDLELLLTDQDPSTIEIHNRRETLFADIVILVVSEQVSACGVSNAYGKAGQAYAVVNYGCLGDNYSFARQIGYLAGCGNYEDQSGNFNWESPAALGYHFAESEDQPGISFATIMGYTDEALSYDPNNDSLNDFDMVPLWSNPDNTVTIKDKQVPTGNDTHNNVAHLNGFGGLYRLAGYKVSLQVALYFQTILEAGEMEFSTADMELVVDRTECRKRGRAEYSGPTTIIKNAKFQRGSDVRISTGPRVLTTGVD